MERFRVPNRGFRGLRVKVFRGLCVKLFRDVRV